MSCLAVVSFWFSTLYQRSLSQHFCLAGTHVRGHNTMAYSVQYPTRSFLLAYCVRGRTGLPWPGHPPAHYLHRREPRVCPVAPVRELQQATDAGHAPRQCYMRSVVTLQHPMRDAYRQGGGAGQSSSFLSTVRAFPDLV